MSDVRVAVFASGSGTNFQCLHEHASQGDLWETALLISDREDAGALDRARDFGVPSAVVPVSKRSADAVAEETLRLLREASVDVVLLAGYLRLIPASVVTAYLGRMLNVHPALLPAFGGEGMYGLRVHEAVVRSGARISGPTVHLVSERYDEGAILSQWPVPVMPDDTAESLQARVLQAEHHLYPRTVDHLCRAVSEGTQIVPLPWLGTRFEQTIPGPSPSEFSS